jgi:hypothetical protein
MRLIQLFSIASFEKFVPRGGETRLGKEKRPPEPIPATFVLSGPHSGQSSQLVLDANTRNAQFLATVAIGLNVSHPDPCSHETKGSGFL